jgi:hypothetical protein
MYDILPYTYKKAEELGVKIFPSGNTKYKVEVYDWNGNFITYCGSLSYSDYPHYMEEKGKEYADKRRQLYKLRHNKYRHKLGSRSYYADQLFW